MARPKEYDRQEALDAATELFWKKGYAGTSINDLVEATGVHRRSMYDEFGGKDGFFLACIGNYARNCNVEAFALLRQEPFGLDSIDAFFRNRVEYVLSREFKGCLAANTAVEKELVDEAAMERVEGGFAATEDQFCRCLMAAQSQGEIAKDKDCRVLAEYMMCFLQGLMVRGKTKQGRASVEAVVETMLLSVRT